MRATPAPPSIPEYELIREIGRGSYGTVWIARSVTGLYRAVKIVWRSSFPDPAPYEREFRGLKEFAAVSLAEPRLLALLHVGRNDQLGFFYYVMELADDAETGAAIDPARYVPQTLRELKQRRGRIPAPETLTLGVDLANALAALHEHNLVHRDIKPSNIIFVSQMPKLADVGLVTSSAMPDESRSRVGNFGYMPPDFPGVPAADVYGLGKVLYELVTGRDHGDFPRLPNNLDTFPDRKALLELNEIFVRACASAPARRYPNAGALLEELRLLHAGKSVHRLRSAERRLSRMLRVTAMLSLIALVAAVGALVERRRAETESRLRRTVEAERDALARRTSYSAALERAQRAIETREYGRARKLLAEAIPGADEPDPRGFEWAVLWREAQGDPASVLRETGPAMQRVRFSPDGRFIAGQDADMIVTLWDAASQNEVRRLPNVFNLAGFSADSRWLTGVNREVGLQRWSVARGEADGMGVDEDRVNRPLSPRGNDQIVCFTDGAQGKPHVLRIWDFAHNREVARVVVGPDADGSRWDFYRRDAVAVTSDGNRCAVALIGGLVQNARWKVEIHDLVSQNREFSEVMPHRITALTFSPDGTRLALALGNTAEVAVLNVRRGDWIWKRRFGTGQASVLAFSPDGGLLAVGAQQVQLVDAATGQLVSDLRGHAGGVEDIAWGPDGTALISSGSGGDVRMWAGLRGAPLEITGLWIPAGGGRKLCLSADGTLLAATDEPVKGALVVSGSDLATQSRGPPAWLPVAFVPGSAELLGLRADGTLEQRRVRASANSELVHEAQIFDAPVALGSSAVLAIDGRTLVAGSIQGQVVFWDVPGRRRIAAVDAGNRALAFVAVSPDGSFALTGGSSKSQARLWDVKSGERRAVFFLPTSRPLCGTFSPNGRRLAIGWSDGSVEIRDAEGGNLVRRLRTDSSFVQSIAYSPDGARLACGAPNGTIHLFAAEDGREVLTLRVPPKPENPANTTVSCLAFAANGSTLAAYLNDGRIRLWRR